MKKRLCAVLILFLFVFSISVPTFAAVHPVAIEEDGPPAPQPVPQTPVAINVLQKDLCLQVSWKNAQNAQGYELSRYDSRDKKWTVLLRANVLNYIDKKVKTGINYTYRVRAYAKINEQVSYTAYCKGEVYQAVDLPGKVTGVKASAGEGTVKLTYNKSSGATGYWIYRQNLASGKFEKIADTSVTSYTDRKLQHKKTYSYQVVAYKTVTQNTSKGSVKRKCAGDSMSSTVKATPVVKLPGAPSGLMAMTGDRKVTLSWNSTKNTSGYRIYLYNTSTKKYDILTDTSSTSYIHKNLKQDQRYQYRVQAYRTLNGMRYYAESFSKTITIQPTKETAKTEKNVAGIHSIQFTAKVRKTANRYSSASSDKKLGTIKAGTQLKVLYRQFKRAQIRLANGDVCWVSNDNLTYLKEHYTTQDYSTAEKEMFINKKGYSSDSKYLIWISLYTQRVNIFEGSEGRWKLIRNARCATGRINKPTPVGSFKIGDRSARGWDYDTYYVKPVVQFYSDYFFHSRLKYYKGGYYDATIGKPASAGCIRMYDEDIKFIYDKMPRGTRVISF